MKKLLMGSVALTLFSISMLIFQMSCKKEANAQTTTTGLTQLNLILYKKVSVVGGMNTDKSLWTCSVDGTNHKKVNISVAAGQFIGEADLTPDGKKIILVIGNESTGESKLYSCLVDGSNLTQISTLTGNEKYTYLNGTY